MDYELDDPLQAADPQSQRPKRVKRPKKSINENLEPAFTATPSTMSEQTQYQPMNEFGLGGWTWEQQSRNTLTWYYSEIFFWGGCPDWWKLQGLIGFALQGHLIERQKQKS